MDMIAPILLICGLTLFTGWLLMSAQARLKGDADDLIDAIDALLPQTQCAQCGYPGCRPYAEAVAGGAAIDLCPPGGRATFEALQGLLGRSGGTAPPAPEPALARIREAECIGCFLCIRACPVDAIIGAPGFMHTVIEDECTGCELCLPACPVDCIDLVPTDKHAKEVPATTIAEVADKGTPTIGTPAIADKGDKGTPTAKAPTIGTPTIADRGTPTIGTPTITSTGTPTSIRDTRPPATHAIRTPTSIRDTHPSATQGTPPVQPCIGCNRCEPVCPENLAPRELLWLSSARKWDSAAELGLERCIECRLCDRVCPSDIPLARIFGDGKQVLANAAALSAQAAHAKARFEAREVRLAAELSAAQARRAERLARQRPAQPGGSP